jgi:hypothetical protein
MKKIIIYFTGLIILSSCTGLRDAGKVLRNEKIKTTDEFLVKKKAPLALPPNYEKIPEPGSILQNKEKEEEKIQKILKVPKTNSISKNKSSSVEESILDRLRK